MQIAVWAVFLGLPVVDSGDRGGGASGLKELLLLSEVSVLHLLNSASACHTKLNA